MRDGNRCRNCGATAKLSVHHIIKARNGGRDTLDNLVTLCASCHRRADAKPKAGFLGRQSRPIGRPHRAQSAPPAATILSTAFRKDLSLDPYPVALG
jgi:5-methylcytosine-specific restriction endonuclease McrA